MGQIRSGIKRRSGIKIKMGRLYPFKGSQSFNEMVNAIQFEAVKRGKRKPTIKEITEIIAREYKKNPEAYIYEKFIKL